MYERKTGFGGDERHTSFLVPASALEIAETVDLRRFARASIGWRSSKISVSGRFAQLLDPLNFGDAAEDLCSPRPQSRAGVTRAIDARERE
jgi:hypothetical protein